MYASRKLRMLVLLAPMMVLAFGMGCKSCKKKPPKTDAPGPVTLAPSKPATTTPAASQPSEPAVPSKADMIQIPELKNVYFDFDKYNIREDQAKTVEASAAWLKQHPKAIVRLEGHCDERGTEEYNVALGDRRSRSVKNQLVYLGIDANRLSTVSYGEMRPADPGHAEASWGKNRRVEFWVSPE